MKLLPAVGLTLVGIYLLSKLSTAGVASRLNLLISSFHFSMNGITPVIQVQVTAQNVTNDSLQFNALSANAFLNGNLIGNVAGFTPVTISALSQVTIPLQVLINASGLFSDIEGILSGSSGMGAQVEIKGTANVSNLLIPVDLIYKAI